MSIVTIPIVNKNYQMGCEDGQEERLMELGRIVDARAREILDKIGKAITIEQIKNAVKLLNQAKIRIYAYYVIGLPWETKETIEQTYKLAKDNTYIFHH
jgi:radical SAM superfamily enzyme